MSSAWVTPPVLLPLQKSGPSDRRAQKKRTVHALQRQWYRNELTQFVAVTRTRGIQVSSRMVRHKACHLLLNFMSKSINACEKAILRFTKQMGLSHHAAMHTAQKNYHKTMEESRHFIEMMRDKLADKDPVLIINMDQTPIPFSFIPPRLSRRRVQKRSTYVL